MIFLLALISCTMLAQVIARYIFNDSMSWPEEFCRYCYIWTVFLSLGYTIRNDSMLRVGVITDLLPRYIRSALKLIIYIIMTVIFAVLARRSVMTVINIKDVTREISSAMQIPMWIMYTSSTVGFALGLVRSVQQAFRTVANFGFSRSTAERTMQEAEQELQGVAMREEQEESEGDD